VSVKVILSKFPKFAPKKFMLRISPYKFSVAVDTLYFSLPSCHRLENRIFGTLNLILKNPTELMWLGCARTLSEAYWLSNL